MLTGQTPFRGTTAEVMYQHQHAPLPLEQLEGVPQPVVVLLEMLLEKDPGRRFQNPTELLKAMPAITGAIETGVLSPVKPAEMAPGRFGGLTQAARTTGTEENFRRQIARYRKRCFWSRGGYCFPG